VQLDAAFRSGGDDIGWQGCRGERQCLEDTEMSQFSATFPGIVWLSDRAMDTMVTLLMDDLRISVRPQNPPKG